MFFLCEKSLPVLTYTGDIWHAGAPSHSSVAAAGLIEETHGAADEAWHWPKPTYTHFSFSLPCVPVYMAVWGTSLQVETLKIKGCACWALVLLLPREASTPLWAQRKFSRLRCVANMQPVSTRWEGFDDMFCLHYTGSLTTKYLNSHPCMPPLSYMYNTI